MMKNNKQPLTPFQETVINNITEEVFEMIAWECGATEDSFARSKLREAVQVRLEQIFRSEFAGFQVRLSSLITTDLDLPQHVNLYGNKSYIPKDLEQQKGLVAEWFRQLNSATQNRQ